MRGLNYLLSLAGFADFQDYLGTFSYLIKPLFILSITSAGFIGFIETYSGISFMLWVFLALGTLFDLFLGWYTNVYYLDGSFETKKFFRGLFKSFITLTFIFFTNQLRIGVEESNIDLEFINSTFTFISALIHYTVVFLIGLYLLLGLAENGAKMKIKACISIVKILKIRINNLEELASNKTN